MRFQFLPLRFEFIALESLYFPPGKAANILRGALGVIFKSLACRPECLDTRVCETRSSCTYARIFEPVAQGDSPSGLADWPRPFVFRGRHLDGQTFEPGQPFHFDLNLFSLEAEVLQYFVRTFAALAREGIGPRRAKAELQTVRRLALGDVDGQIVYQDSSPMPIAPVDAASLDLDPDASAPHQIRVEFLSPTELKHGHRIAGRPEFPVLFARLRDRLSTLRTLYGPGPLDIDFHESGGRAQGVRMTRCEIRALAIGRRSTRTGQSHSIGGFIGFAEYEGDLAEFLPYLEAGRWVGVGRHAVWGKGEILVVRISVVTSSFKEQNCN